MRNEITRYSTDGGLFHMNLLYETYLRSDEWRRKAEERLELDGHKCQMCGCQGTATNPLQVHHLTYHNIYRENIDKDLVTLCKVCHQNIHNVMNRITNRTTGQRGWKDSLSYSVHVVSIDEHACEAVFKEGSKK